MGFLSSFLGSDQADAAMSGAANQVMAVDDAVREQRRTERRGRADLEPFRKTGLQSLGRGSRELDRISKLVNSPRLQRDFIERNPFFDSLAGRARDDLFSNEAARGKVGSGGTAEALQNSMVLLGNDLLSQNINHRFGIADRRFDVAGMGANAAMGRANITTRTGETISDLRTQGGNAIAAGQVGAANARGAGVSNVIGTAMGIGKLLLSDARHKQDAEQVGRLSNGLPVYRFRYVGEDRFQIGVMAQEVQAMIPDAVHEIEGVLYVDYEAIH